MFDGIVKLTIQDPDITAMFSKEGEVIPFRRQAKIKQNEGVDGWLLDVERQMRDTLQKEMKNGVTSYENMDRKLWVKDPKVYGQVVATVA